MHDKNGDKTDVIHAISLCIQMRTGIIVAFKFYAESDARLKNLRSNDLSRSLYNAVRFLAVKY